MPKSSVQRTLNGLSIALYLEALVLYLAAGAAIWTLFSGEENSLVTVAFLALVSLGAAVWLTFAAKGITKGKRWARSAGTFWQLMQIAIGFGVYDASVIGAVVILLLSGAVLVTLFTKDVVAATRN
jgi:hypothetical protein